jgi:hypothetical protein
MEQRRGRFGAGDGLIVADVNPQSAGIGLAHGEDPHGRVVAMQSLGGKDMSVDPAIERHECKFAAPT